MTDRKATPMMGMQELATLLLKHHGIHEGYWLLQVTMNLGVINIGPTLQEVVPTGIVGFQGVGLTPVDKLDPPSLTVDAAKVNPAPKEQEQAT